MMILFDRQRSQVGREAGRERGGSRLPDEQRARLGVQSHDIMTWAKDRGLTYWATQVPLNEGSLFKNDLCPGWKQRAHGFEEVAQLRFKTEQA